MNDADLCRSRGWGPGTKLVGNEGYRPTVIEITAVGEEVILAKMISHDSRVNPAPWEKVWALSCREWTEVKS